MTAIENTKELMTDEQTPDQSSSNPEDLNPLGDFDSADDLDKILAEAASLASDISLEVGESSPVSDGSGPDSDTDQAGDVAAQLDAELAALEELVTSASDELGDLEDDSKDEVATTSQEASSEDTPPPTPDPVVDSTATEVPDESHKSDEQVTPDVAAQSTEEVEVASQGKVESKTAVDEIPEEPPKNKNPQSSGIVLSPKPGVVGTGMFEPDTKEHEEEEFEEEDSLPKPKWVQILENKVSPAALAACDRGVKVLDMLDHRIGDKLTDPIKGMVGWAALATLGTAFIVYVLSFFWTP